MKPNAGRGWPVIAIPGPLDAFPENAFRVESAVSDSGSYDLNKNLVTTEDSQEGGNSITGAYSLTVTTESTEIDNEGDEFSAGWDNFTNNKFDDVTQTQTGNHVTGAYSLNNSDIHSSSLGADGFRCHRHLQPDRDNQRHFGCV